LIRIRIRDPDGGRTSRDLLVFVDADLMLAGALPGRDLATEILYAGDPFGVFYLVGWLAGA